MSRIDLRERSGFALPLVIIALLLMGTMAVAALATSSDERRSARAMRRSVAAFYAAEAGLYDVRAAWSDSLVSALGPGDSVDLGWRTVDSGARYRAVIHRYDDNLSQKIFGLAVDGRGAGPRGGQRQLTFMMTDPRLPLHHNFHATFVSIGGLVNAGSSGSISGYDDSNPSDDCAEGDQPGAVTPDSSLWEGATLVTSNVSWLAGSVDYLWGGTPAATAVAMRIDWRAILELTPDYDVQQPSDFPAESWYLGYWPVIFVADSLTLTGAEVPSGHGLIVAEGDLDLGDQLRWDGLILVGGRLNITGDVETNGGIVTGLNLLLGEAITYSQIGPGPQDIDYHACNIFEASMAAMNKGYRGYGSPGIKPLTTRPFSEVLR